MRDIDAELIAERADLRLGWDLRPVGVGQFPRYRWSGSAITAVDAGLADGRSREIEGPADATVLAATADLATVILADAQALYVTTETGRRTIPVAKADSATIHADGRAVVTGRIAEERHRAYLVSLEDGTVMHQVDLDTYVAGVSALAHPYDGSVLLDAGEGQDGNHVFLARIAGVELAVERVFQDRIVADFSPAGDRLLLMPHPNAEPLVSLVDWPGLHTIAALDPHDLELDSGFDFYGCFVRDGVVVLKTFEEGLVIAGADLGDAARVHLPGVGLTYDDDDIALDTLLGLGRDTIGVDVWRDGADHATAWHLTLT